MVENLGIKLKYSGIRGSEGQSLKALSTVNSKLWHAFKQGT